MFSRAGRASAGLAEVNLPDPLSQNMVSKRVPDYGIPRPKLDIQRHASWKDY
jgi:hypothetical protein